MWSARRTVANRWEISTVMAPTRPAASAAALAYRSNGRARPRRPGPTWARRARAQGRVGHQAAGDGHLLPLPLGELGAGADVPAQLALNAGGERPGQVARLASLQGGEHGCLVVDALQVAHPHRLAEDELEADEVLEAGRHVAPPLVDVDPAQVDVLDGDPALGGRVAAEEQLHQRGLAGTVLAHDGHDRTWSQPQVDVDQHVGVRARLAKAHPLEAMPRQTRSGAAAGSPVVVRAAVA